MFVSLLFFIGILLDSFSELPLIYPIPTQIYAMHIINLLKAEKLRPCNKQPHYHGFVLDIADEIGAQKLGFHLEVISPKNFSCPYHYHEQEEELFLVLEGEAIVRCNDVFRKVGPGDLIFYHVGPENTHNMYNHTDKPFKFLALSNVSADYDVCHYPDSGKVSSEEGYMQNRVKVNYYKDEEDPAKYWPEHALRGEI
jgi:uncharacterized cupin superfamily protein